MNIRMIAVLFRSCSHDLQSLISPVKHVAGIRGLALMIRYLDWHDHQERDFKMVVSTEVVANLPHEMTARLTTNSYTTLISLSFRFLFSVCDQSIRLQASSFKVAAQFDHICPWNSMFDHISASAPKNVTPPSSIRITPGVHAS